MINKKGMIIKSWQTPTYTLNSSLYNLLTLILLAAFLYITSVALTNHSSFPIFHSNHQVRKQNTLLKASSMSVTAKYSDLLFAKYLYTCSTDTRASKVLLPNIKPNDISSRLAFFLINWVMIFRNFCKWFDNICNYFSPWHLCYSCNSWLGWCYTTFAYKLVKYLGD